MILAIGRAERFSPNSVEKDAAILEGVADVLRHDGYVVETVGETALQPGSVAEACLSMGRLPQTLAYLTQMQARGSVVVNSPAGVDLCCNRRRLTEALRMAGVRWPLPKAATAIGSKEAAEWPRAVTTCSLRPPRPTSPW